MKEVASFDDLLSANGTKYDTVDCHGTTLRLGSLSSASMIAWLRINNSEGEEGKFAGLDLLVRCIVNADGDRIPDERRLEYVTAFSNKDSGDNRIAIKKARELNGLNDLAKLAEALKNASGEATSAASPSALPPPPAA